MTKFEKLMDCVVNSDISYLKTAYKPLPAQSVRVKGSSAIVFNEEAFETDAEKYVALAHEKAHCDGNIFYTTNSPLLTRGYCERHAWRRTILDVLPFDRLMTAVETCKGADGLTLHDLSECLDLPCDFVEFALQEYICMGESLEEGN